MTSVRHTDGDVLASGDEPSFAGDWTAGLWMKFASGNYGGEANPTIWSWDNASTIICFQVPNAAPTTVVCILFDGSAVDSTTILTASDTGWFFGAIRHTSASNDYVVSWRKEGVSTFTTDTITNTDSLNGTVIRIGSNGFSEHVVDGSTRSFFIQAAVLSDGDLLTASTSLSAPSGTNQAFLDLDSPTNAGDNEGTGLDYTVTGTLQTDSTEPDPSIGGGGGGAVTVDHSSVLSFPALARKPRNDNGKWMRSQGGLWVPRRTYSIPRAA